MHKSMSMPQRSFDLFEKDNGFELKIFTCWSKEIEWAISDKKITSLILFWSTIDIFNKESFDKNYSSLNSVLHVTLNMVECNFTPLYYLSNVEKITVRGLKGPKLDFSHFPKLKEVSCDSSPAAMRLFERTDLQKLSLISFDKKYVHALSNMQNLKELTIIGCGAESFDSLSSLHDLEYLRLTRCRKLMDNHFISNLTKLRFLKVQESSGFGNLDALLGLLELQVLSLERVGTVDSLTPLEGMLNLRIINISPPRKSCVRELDISKFLENPNCRTISILGNRIELTREDSGCWIDWQKKGTN